MPSYVSHLEAAIDGTRLPAREQHTLHEGRPIWVRYDLGAVSRALNKETLQKRPPTIWRYRELLPVEDERVVVSLGEGMSPLLRCDRLGGSLGLSNLFIKDESQMPTGSFKDRGQTVAITMAKWFGVKRVAIPTAGNAGGSMAAYAARAGMEAFVFMPEDTPEINQYETVQAGAHAYLVNGLINDCAKIVLDGREAMGWFDFSTLKEPYRIEGKKTMGLELAQQFDWKLPDVILYPTGGGTGLIGMWKAFQELRAIGWLESETMPRMVAVQSTGCCPIVTAFDKGERFAELHENAHTVAAGIRVPAAIGDFMILDAVRESKGCAIAVDEERITEWMFSATARTGISICPETAACVGALEALSADGWIGPKERVVIFNTGALQKYPEAMACDVPTLDAGGPVDYASLG
ncbi:MAG: threonine synthase [Woeseiaceae bacterium]